MKVIVIGAGAAGLTAAIFAAQSGATVLLLEKTRMAGKKILISGGTRCNVLPMLINEQQDYYSSSPRIMQHIFKTWNIKECHTWLQKDIKLKMAAEQASNKWFPASNSAKEVRDLLLQKALETGVEVTYEADIIKIRAENAKWFCYDTRERCFEADKIIISTGGKSFPQMGTDGTGYELLRELGHTIIPTYPALTPLLGKHPANMQLAGVSLEVELSVKLNKKKKYTSRRQGFLFTHKGYSGPTVLELSHHLVLAFMNKEKQPILMVNWNGFSPEKWQKILTEKTNSLVMNHLKKYLPKRLVEAVCQEAGLDERKINELNSKSINRLIELLTAYQLQCTGYEGFAKAEVTGGGVSLTEIDKSNMQSKILPGLYLCGEVLDVFGRIGGFNFYWSWLTGRLAGSSVMK